LEIRRDVAGFRNFEARFNGDAMTAADPLAKN